MTRRDALAVLTCTALACTALAGCSWMLPPSTARVRMVVEFDTPEGLKVASSVIELAAQGRIAAGTQNSSPFTTYVTRGEAVVIDSSNGPAFALLVQPNAKGGVDGSLLRALHGGQWIDPQDRWSFVGKMGASNAHFTAVVPPDGWPMFVRFGDLSNPMSIKIVDPRDLGVRRVTVETTNYPVTTGIQKRLPWLSNFYALIKGKNWKPDGFSGVDIPEAFSIGSKARRE